MPGKLDECYPDVTTAIALALSREHNADVVVYRKTGLISVVLLTCMHFVVAQSKEVPSNASVCQLFQNSSAYDGKFVRIRGVFAGSFEGSYLVDPKCQKSIWLRTPNALFLRNVAAIVVPRRSPIVPTADFELVRDKEYEKFDRLTNSYGNGNWPSCADYQVTATFTGRLDHRLDFVEDEKGGNGFGQLGVSEFQIVLRSVSDVEFEEDPCPSIPHPTRSVLPDRIPDAR